MMYFTFGQKPPKAKKEAYKRGGKLRKWKEKMMTDEGGGEEEDERERKEVEEGREKK